jgi:primosomal protein N' (replication factor Y)
VIADVVFDLPLRHPFSYAVPDGMRLGAGQRVSAPLRGRARVGVVVALREGDAAGLRAVERPVEPVAILSGSALELGRWAAEESLSSWGSTLLSLLPPPPRRAAEAVAPPPEARPGAARAPELWTGPDRHQRLLEALRQDAGAALVIAPDRDGAARWAARVDGGRLDSDAPEAARRAAWFAAARGRTRIVTGTRSALLVPLPAPATLALLDEHDPAHKPPGAPRIHSRDLLARRAALDGSRLVLLSATPSVESWWRADDGQIARDAPPAGPWPEIATPDTRGILRNHPLTLPLTRAIEDMSRAGRRVALIVSRAAATLICAECGAVLRCPDCGVALAFSREERRLACRLCVRAEPSPDACPGCGGHRLGPLGWDAERVEAAVRRRFPALSVSRTDVAASVVIAPPGFLRTQAPGRLGAVGIVTLDAVLSATDFRGGERAFALLWAAAEAVGGDGRVVAQTLHPEHYAVEAAAAQRRARFYAPEIKFRAELGYPPFRRICVVSARGKTEADARALIGDCASAVAGVAGLTVYPAAPRAAGPARRPRWQFVIKGPADLPRRLSGPLGPFLDRPRRSGGMVEIEMDPV